MQSDSRIFREVNALSRLSHRFIVRYYTTWVETSERMSSAASDSSDYEIKSDDGMTSVPQSKEKYGASSDRLSFDLSDLDDMGSGSKSSFPSIHFSSSSSPKIDEEDDSGGAFGDLFGPEPPVDLQPITPPKISRTLYIQMVRISIIRVGIHSNLTIGICRASNSQRGK